jgi:hypothetical protein
MTLWFSSQNRQAAGSNPARDKIIFQLFFVGRLLMWHSIILARSSFYYTLSLPVRYVADGRGRL